MTIKRPNIRFWALITLTLAPFGLFFLAVNWESSNLKPIHQTNEISYKYDMQQTVATNELSIAEEEIYLEINFRKVLVPPARAFSRGGILAKDIAHPDDNSIARYMAERKSRLKQTCQKIKQGKSVSLPFNRLKTRLYTSDKHKAIACSVAKAGTTNWRAVFFELAGFLTHNESLYNLWYNARMGTIDREIQKQKNMTLRKHVHDFREVSTVAARARQLTSRYHSWLTVRHPFERIVSCYRDKVVRTNYLNTMVIKFLRNHQGRSSLPEDYNATFPEFIEYVFFCFEHDCIDEHYAPVYLACAPCDLDYDFIAKFESLPMDGPYILKQFKLHHVAIFPSPKNGYNKGKATVDIMKEYFDQLSLGQIRKLFELYKNDFLIFGYI